MNNAMSSELIIPCPTCGAPALSKVIGNIVEEEGYVIFDIEKEMYVNIDENGAEWDIDKFTVVSGDIIDSIQDIISHNKGKIIVGLAITFFDMIRWRVDLTEELLVIPCVEYKGEEPKLDYVNAFTFDRTK